MQISRILKFKPVPGTPTNPLLRQILRWVVWSQIPSKKKRILLDSFRNMALGLQTLSVVTLTFLSGIGQVNGTSQNHVWAGASHPKLTWKA